MVTPIVSKKNQCMDGEIIQADAFQDFETGDPLGSYDSGETLSGHANYFFPLGYHLTEGGKLTPVERHSGLHDHWVKINWTLYIPFEKLFEGTDLENQYRETLRKIPWYKRRRYRNNVKECRPGDEYSCLRPEEPDALTIRIYELKKEVAHRRDHIEEDVRSLIKSFFESNDNDPISGVIPVSNVDYVVSMQNLKTRRIKRRIPIGEIMTAHTVMSDCHGGTQDSADFIYGTFEGKLHTFRLRFEPR